MKVMESVRPLNNKRLLRPALNCHAAFVLVSLAGVILFGGTLAGLARFSWASETYSHIVIIPLMSLWLIYTERTAIFANTVYSLAVGLPVVVVSLILHLIGRQYAVQLSANDALSVATFSAVAFWTGGFIASYGVRTFTKALFPLLMLLFMVPLPDSLYEIVVYTLQRGSTEVTYWLFRITGVPMLRNGFAFSLPGLDIEVAKQCSGIRSGMALFIVSLLDGHFFLKTFKNKVILVISAVFITIFKNGLRIVTLSLLAIYVDMRIFSGDLHKKGGIPFFALAFVTLTLVLWILRRTEKR
jgi:exosortase